MIRRSKADAEAYRAALNNAKKEYFAKLLSPFVDPITGALDTKKLKAENPNLHYEFRMGFRGIRAGIAAMGYTNAASVAAKGRTIGKQVNAIALDALTNNAEHVAQLLGIEIAAVAEIKDELTRRMNNPVGRKRKEKVEPENVAPVIDARRETAEANTKQAGRGRFGRR